MVGAVSPDLCRFIGILDKSGSGSRLIGTRRCRAVGNRTYRVGLNAMLLENAPTVLPSGRHCFQLCLCGAVRNRTYRAWGQYGAVGNRTYRVGLNAVRGEIAPTNPDKSGLKPRGESVYLFLESTIVFGFLPA